MIHPTASFSENLQLLPSIEGISRIDLINPAGEAVAEIENVPGKQGSSLGQGVEDGTGVSVGAATCTYLWGGLGEKRR